MDLGILLTQRGEHFEERLRVPCGVDDFGVVAVSIGVDGGNHDVIHFETGNAGRRATDAALLTEAITASQQPGTRSWPARTDGCDDRLTAIHSTRSPPDLRRPDGLRHAASAVSHLRHWRISTAKAVRSVARRS